MIRKILIGLCTGVVMAFAFIATTSLWNSTTESGHAGPVSPRLSAGTLAAAPVPQPVLNGLASQAAKAGIGELRTVGSAGAGDFSRSVVVGSSKSGSPFAAIVDWNGHSSFMSPDSVFRGSPLAVYSNQAGTATTVAAASIAVFVKASVERVTVHYADNTSRVASLTSWPQGGYASFAEVATDSKKFPQLVKAYGADGSLLATKGTQIEPLCPGKNPDCITHSP